VGTGADMVVELWPWFCCCEELGECPKEFVLPPAEDDKPEPEDVIDPEFRSAEIVVDVAIDREL
jgi:hypothetical protein